MFCKLTHPSGNDNEVKIKFLLFRNTTFESFGLMKNSNKAFKVQIKKKKFCKTLKIKFIYLILSDLLIAKAGSSKFSFSKNSLFKIGWHKP